MREQVTHYGPSLEYIYYTLTSTIFTASPPASSQLVIFQGMRSPFVILSLFLQLNLFPEFTAQPRFNKSTTLHAIDPMTTSTDSQWPIPYRISNLANVLHNKSVTQHSRIFGPPAEIAGIRWEHYFSSRNKIGLSA
ncbi:hypothetical protein BDV30DRAFT_51332 [Aspergillus minisclerotigenes]|uniref:Uncharacterized protein n=1 Tax=Aspergillus minisclerotigenes TaxID=656917 RepID=A0A5N6IL22_9EURO|nr:hypothetical protein BDV30DRAFT_51332 [Aspergillus minisclerotigenes]